MRGMGCPPSGARSGGHPTQLSMSSVPQSRWKPSPRTRRQRLYGSNMCWEALGAYHSLTARGHHVPLCQAILEVSVSVWL